MVRTLSLLAGALVVVAIVVRAASPGEGRVPETITLPGGTRFGVETVIGGLDTVWDLIRAPDGSIWFSERAGRVSRLDPASGTRTVVGEVPDVLERGEAGLMGIALHPAFPAVPLLYAVHSYDTGGGIGNRLVRLRYEDGSLGRPEILLDGLAGRRNHDGSRIAFGPDGLLYMTMGDAGDRPASQDVGSLSGKILRLAVDGGPAPGNPFGDRIWSLGHRNPQGLVFHPEGMLYSTEHGAGDEDELNLVEPGGNYGWPALEGFCNTGEEAPWCAANDAVEPLWAWSPTVGIAGADLYAGDAVAGWDGDILAVSLRGASLYRVRLSADGRRAVSGETLLAGDFGRLRDVLVGPGGEIYLATSNRDGRGRPARADDRILRLTPR